MPSHVASAMTSKLLFTTTQETMQFSQSGNAAGKNHLEW
jgi:hypothetical protein